MELLSQDMRVYRGMPRTEWAREAGIVPGRLSPAISLRARIWTRIQTPSVYRSHAGDVLGTAL